MSNITPAFVMMMSFLTCRIRSASRSDFARMSRGSILVSEDFISSLIAVMKVSKQLGSLPGNQLLLLLNLGSFELFLVDPKCALSLILQ